MSCKDVEFGPLRVDVFTGTGEEKVLEVDAWRTFRGNEWGNKGEKMGVSREADGWVRVEGVRALGGKEYFVQRAGCKFYFLFPLFSYSDFRF